MKKDQIHFCAISTRSLWQIVFDTTEGISV